MIQMLHAATPPVNAPRQVTPLVLIGDHDRFTLDQEFVAQYKTQSPPWGPLGEITFRRTYSRLKDDGTYEEWWETVERVVNGVYTYQKWHCNRHNLPWKDTKATASARKMYDHMFHMRWMPAGRGIYSCGTKMVEKIGVGPLLNCAFVTSAFIASDFAAPFVTMMDLSMLGIGVGGDTKGRFTFVVSKPNKGDDVHVVQDSREGWTGVVRRVLLAFSGNGSLPYDIDYSMIRPRGAPISTGGVAPGPDPLRLLVDSIIKTLTPLVGQCITSEAIVDIYNYIGVCVVAGGKRRSAIITFGDPSDTTFLDLKNPETNGDKLLSHRWTSNNSVYGYAGMDYDNLTQRIQANGEPGIIYLKTAKTYGRLADKETYADRRVGGCNPCGEQFLESYYDENAGGLAAECCNLVETFPSMCDDYDQYEEVLKYAYLYAKSVTLLPLHDKASNAVMMRNRRIGCSQSGVIDNINRIGRHNHISWCNYGYDYLRRLDGMYSDWLAVPRSIKITTVKPSGTTSLLPGVSPGIHYPHAEYYYRTIRMEEGSDLLQALRKSGYRVEPDVTDSLGRRMVVYFAVHEKSFTKGKADASIWEQLLNAADMQRFWSDNAVSQTVTFKPSEVNDLASALSQFEDKLKSVSFLPLEDHQYQQAPYQTITKEEYEEYVSRLLPVDFSTTIHEATDKFCNNEICSI